VKEATDTLRKWRGLTEGVEPAANPSQAFVEALSDDLNTAGAIAVLHGLAKAGEAAGLKASADLLGLLLPNYDAAFTNSPIKNLDEARINRILELRKKSRAAKDFAMSDKIRDGFIVAGVEVKDTPDGVQWSVTSKFKSKLLLQFEEALK